MDRLSAMQAFVRLVDLGTFSAVAREMRIKQSTVSKWLATLEEDLGVQLVERTTRNRRITESGEIFYARARELLASYDDVVARLRDDSPEPRGRIRMTVPVVFGRLFIMPEVGRFISRHAHVEIEVTLSDTYVNLLEEGFDLAIRVGLPVDSTLRARVLGQTGRHLVASPGYLERNGTPICARDLGKHQCLLHTGANVEGLWTFRSGGRATRASVSGRLSANNTEALLTLARDGHGIAMLAAWLVEDDLRNRNLVSVLPALELPTAPIQALMPPTKHVRPPVRSFVDFIAEALAPRFRDRRL